MPTKIDWGPVRALARQVLEQGNPLELTEGTRFLLLKTAQEVGLSQQQAEDALRNVEEATRLLEKSIQRINDGSDRVTRALRRMSDLRDKGDLDGACQQMHELLAVEVVPLYRKQADKKLKELNQLSEVATTGRVSTNLPDRPQLTVLAHRVQKGHALELTDDLRSLFHRTAPTAGFSEAETKEALQSTRSAASLLGGILSRLHEGKERITRALFQMTRLRDAGDLEGARQQMRDVLVVELVPQYRRMAEENLAGLDSPPPGT